MSRIFVYYSDTTTLPLPLPMPLSSLHILRPASHDEHNFDVTLGVEVDRVLLLGLHLGNCVHIVLMGNLGIALP